MRTRKASTTTIDKDVYLHIITRNGREVDNPSVIAFVTIV